MDANTSLIVVSFVLTTVLLVIVVVNTYRISNLKKKIDDTVTLHHGLHTIFDFVETEDMDSDVKRHLKKIVSGKLYPMLVEYLDKYMETNGVTKYLNRNEKKIHKIVDMLVERATNEMGDMKPDENVVNFLKDLDLDEVIQYIEKGGGD